jgi:AMMECR1 domain-containing protein
MGTKRLQTGKHGLLSRWQGAKANTHDWNTRLFHRRSIVYVNIGQATKSKEIQRFCIGITTPHDNLIIDLSDAWISICYSPRTVCISAEAEGL